MNFQYRKKPVVIEAVQLSHLNSEHTQILPKWFLEAVVNDTIKLLAWDKNNGAYIETLEGTMHAAHDDYIIRGVDGELYPCKPDIFERTYERVE